MFQVSKKLSGFPRSSILLLLIFLLVIPLLPLLIGGRWSWWEAWAYAAIFIVGFIISRILTLRKNPDLLLERVRFAVHEDVKPWDKVLAPLVGFGGGLIAVVAGFDERFGWTAAFSPAVKILALGLILAGFALATYALVENRFFSSVVRIQTERGHKVVTGGPYRWVRHPGYAGSLLTYLALPLLLDSWWAYLMVLIIAPLLVIRTHLEDKTLIDELEGYADYTRQVRYRLLPGIW